MVFYGVSQKQGVGDMSIVGELHWLSITGAALAYYILGAVWFSPFTFGGLWDKSLGFDRPKSWRPAKIYYLGPLAGCFLAALATDVLLVLANVRMISDAVLLGVTAGTGYAAAVSFVNAITPNNANPILYGLVTGSYHLAGVVLCAVILVI